MGYSGREVFTESLAWQGAAHTTGCPQLNLDDQPLALLVFGSPQACLWLAVLHQAASKAAVCFCILGNPLLGWRDGISALHLSRVPQGTSEGSAN